MRGSPQGTHHLYPFLRFPIQGFLAFPGPSRGSRCPLCLQDRLGEEVPEWGTMSSGLICSLCLLSPGLFQRSLWVLKGAL